MWAAIDAGETAEAFDVPSENIHCSNKPGSKGTAVLTLH
jgi:hypothetical protein